MFDRSTLSKEGMFVLNRAYIQIATCGIYTWKTRYRALTPLPTELLDELEAEYDR